MAQQQQQGGCRKKKRRAAQQTQQAPEYNGREQQQQQQHLLHPGVQLGHALETARGGHVPFGGCNSLPGTLCKEKGGSSDGH